MRIRSACLLSIVLCAFLLPLLSAGCEPSADSRPVVAIVRGEDPNVMVAQAIALLGGMDRFVHNGQTVVLKPNLTSWHGPNHPLPGMTTDVRVVAALAELIRKSADCNVVIAEGAGKPTMQMYQVYGYTALAERMGLKLVDLNEDARIERGGEGIVHGPYPLPRTTQQADVMINCPVLKTHQLVAASVGMKNYYGLLDSSRPRYHELADEVLSDLAKLQRTDLVVVDGLVGMEGQGPLEGTPVPMNLVIAGTDPVAVDAVSAAVMGFEPNRIRHLTVARDRGLGECELSRIEVRGVPIAEVRKVFKHPVAFGYSPVDSGPARERIRAISRRGFASRQLKLDPNEYPLTAAHPWNAGFYSGRPWFRLTCDVVDRPAMAAEIDRWIASPADSEKRQPEATERR